MEHCRIVLICVTILQSLCMKPWVSLIFKITFYIYSSLYTLMSMDVCTHAYSEFLLFLLDKNLNESVISHSQRSVLLNETLISTQRSVLFNYVLILIDKILWYSPFSPRCPKMVTLPSIILQQMMQNCCCACGYFWTSGTKELKIIKIFFLFQPFP